MLLEVQGMPGSKAIQSELTKAAGLTPDGSILGAAWEISRKWCETMGKESGKDDRLPREGRVIVYDREGRLVTVDAVGNTYYGGGAFMDRDGNIYAIFASLWPADRKQKRGNILVKFRGLGGKYPVGGLVAGNDAGEGLPVAGAHLQGGGRIAGALWIYPRAPRQGGGAWSCNCCLNRMDMDYFARIFIPDGTSVEVLDANANRVAGFGRYGNVDDTEADLREGRDGIRLAQPRAVAVSDAAFYVADHGTARILRAAFSYAAEETVPVP
jgi:hypothetical protein